jgi:hypothetical protein
MMVILYLYLILATIAIIKERKKILSKIFSYLIFLHDREKKKNLPQMSANLLQSYFKQLIPDDFRPEYIKRSETFGQKYYIDKDGYKRFCNSDKLLSRYIAGKARGRKLESWEVVHHRDGNKLNNHIYNLKVCSQEEHERIHRNNQALYGNWYGPICQYKTNFNVH